MSAIGGVYGWVMGREEVAVSCLVLVSPQQPTPDCEGMPDTTPAVSVTLSLGTFFWCLCHNERRKTTTLLFVNVVVAFSFRCSPLTPTPSTSCYLLYLPTCSHSSVQVCIRAPCSRFFVPNIPIIRTRTQTQQAGAKILTQRTSYSQVCKDGKPHRKQRKNGAQVVCKRKKKKKSSARESSAASKASTGCCSDAECLRRSRL